MHDWDVCRNFCSIVLTQIKRGIYTWDNYHRIDQCRSVHLYGASAAGSANKRGQRPQHNNSNGNHNNQSPKPAARPILCHRFNDGSCQYTSSHRYNGRFLQHCCTHCFGRSSRLLLDRYSSYVVPALSMYPRGVISIMRFATVWIN